MSQTPRKRTPARRLSPGVDPQEGVSDYDYEEEYEDSPDAESISEASRLGRQSRKSGYDDRRGSPRSYRGDRSAYVAPKRDIFPYIMGGVIGSLVVGLMLVLYLLTNRGAGTSPGGAGNSSIPTPITSSGTQAPAAGSDAPRITMEEFKKLYDSANKPLIIDVRPKGGFDAGHIRGAISFPEAEVDARIAELPKDKLVIAYCA